MAKAGGSTKKQQQQLLPRKHKQLDYDAPVLSIRQVNGRHAGNSNGSELRDSPGPPLFKLPLPKCEQQKLDYNAPLLSIRRLNSSHPGNSTSTALRDNPGPSPFNKLSAELSCESLSIPGAVPFVWELAPGRRKVANDSHNADVSVPQKCSADADAMDKQLPAYPTNLKSLGSLFRHGSIEAGSSRHISSLAVTASSARFSIASSADDDDNGSSDAAFTTATDAFTTACGLSNDDFEGGTLDAQSSSDDRSFIMHRFLPAAHAIAYDSPPTPSQRSPAAYFPSSLLHNRLQRFSPLHPRLANSSAPIRSPASPFLHLYGKTHHEAQHQAPLCGMFSFRFLNIFPTSQRDLCWFKQQKRSNARELPSSSKLGDILWKDDSSDDDQDFVARQVQVDSQKKRAHKLMERVRPSFVTKGSSLHELLQFGEDETPTDSVSPFSKFNPGKNGATMSLFLEGKGFLGFPKECNANDVASETDGSATCFETPRRSLSDSKFVEIDTCTNEIESSSSRITSFFSRLHRSASPGQRDLGTENASLRSHTGIRPPRKASTSPNRSHDCTLQQPDNSKNGEILAPEKKTTPILTSIRRSNSPSRFRGAKKRLEPCFSAAILSPPLPKSPSDSWLWKAIPVRASKLSPLSETDKVCLEANASWEAIVKDSQFQNGHLRSSQELSYNVAKFG